MISPYEANPRIGHLEELGHIFLFLEKHLYMGRLAYDSKITDIDEAAFIHNSYLIDFYGDVEEDIATRVLEN